MKFCSFYRLQFFHIEYLSLKNCKSETKALCTLLFYKLMICTNTRNCVMQELLLHMHKAIGLDLGDSGNGKARDITYSMRKEITAAGIIPLNRNESVPNV